MFGHQDNHPTKSNDQANAHIDAVAGQAQPNIPTLSKEQNFDPNWQHPGESLDKIVDEKIGAISPAGGYPKPLSSKEPIPAMPPTPNPPASSAINQSADDNQLTDATDDDLIHIKNEALDELLPLIDKLNQRPAEQFRTLMMIIQASDNHSLVHRAYEVAQTIDDQKLRAQALLDIINEINYFTQQPEV